MATVWQPDPLCTQQIAVCTGVLRGAPAQLSSGSQMLGSNQTPRSRSVWNPAPPLLRDCEGGDGFSGNDRRQAQELLWQQFFLDPTMWWDNRRDKKSSRSPDFRRKGSGEVLWLNSLFKPAWVDQQLVSLDEKTASVSTLCQHGKLTEAVGVLESLTQTNFSVSQSLFCTLIKLCAAKKDLVAGRRVHELTVKHVYETDAYLGNHILRMYACAGRLQEAMDVFTRVGKPDTFMWFSIISAYAKHGKPNEAIRLYHEMRRSGVKAGARIFVAALQACAISADLESGRTVHSDVLLSGILPNLFVGNCLVDMYAKCGELKDARQVFDSLTTKDVVTWTTMIAGYSQQGLSQEALVLYEQVEQEGRSLANHVTFACLLKACASAGAVRQGRRLHLQIVERGQLDNILVGNCLVDMYAKCGELEDARQVFDSLATKDVVTWTALIAGYAQQALGQEALELYVQMEKESSIVPNHFTFACILKACASAGALQKGRQLHSRIVELGTLQDIVVGNCLVDMYAKCGELEDAQQVFDSLATKDVVTWTALIAGYAQQGLGQEALVLYGQMEQEGLVLANDVTFSCLLNACASVGALQTGMELRSQIVERGQLNNIVLGNCLVDMYAKCGELKDAYRVLTVWPRKMWLHGLP